MTNLESAFNAALAKAKELSKGVLSFNNGSETLTCSVYKSVIKDYNRNMQDAGYTPSYDDLYVLASATDVSSWGLQPMTSKVSLDGVDYQLGQTINKTQYFWTIWLRAKN